MRLNETVLDRDQAKYLSGLVHGEWLGSVQAGHHEDYKDWTKFAAQLILEVCLEPPHNIVPIVSH